MHYRKQNGSFSGSAKPSSGSSSFSAYKRQVQSTFRHLPSLLSRVQYAIKPAQSQHAKLCLTKKHWQELVGSSLSASTSPVAIKEETLEVIARSAVAKSALLSAKGVVIKRKTGMGLNFGWNQIVVRLGRF